MTAPRKTLSISSSSSSAESTGSKKTKLINPAILNSLEMRNWLKSKKLLNAKIKSIKNRMAFSNPSGPMTEQYKALLKSDIQLAAELTDLLASAHK